MRLGLIIYGSLETVSGGYLYDRQLVAQLRERGHTVEIIGLPWRDYARHLTDNLASRLRERLRQERFDLLLQDELNHPSLWLTNRLVRAQLDYPIVSIVHHLRCSEARPAWQNRLYRLIERAYLRSVDGFVYNSQTTRAVVEALTGERRPAVVAVPAGDRLGPRPDRATVEARSRRAGPLRLLFVGNLIPRKGLHTLLAALGELRRGDWQLTVVGSPIVDQRYTERIRHQIERLGLGDRVRLLGTLADAALATHFRQHDLLVVPSSYEGYGIVYVEAMGFGLPVIAGSIGAAGEVVTDGRDGFLIPPAQPAPLAARLRELARDRQRLVELSLAALERAARQPTWAETTASIADFLTALAGRWSGRATVRPARLDGRHS